MKNVIVSRLIFGAAVLVSTAYVFAEGEHQGGHGHGATHESMHWESPSDAAARINPIKNEQTSVDRGKKIYRANCISCHGKSAKGDGPLALNLRPKPTNLTLMAGKHSDGDFEWKIANGRGFMPAWKSSLTENQRWDVVNYIQSLESQNDEETMSGIKPLKTNHPEINKKELRGVETKMLSPPDDHSGHVFNKHKH